MAKLAASEAATAISHQVSVPGGEAGLSSRAGRPSQLSLCG